MKIEDYDFSIVIEDNELIHRLNKKYLGVDAPTDVIAFPANEVDPESQYIYLGDILISFPIAKKQAGDYKHDIFEELMILIVHGILHLLGHDHQNENEKTKMFSLQHQLLKK
ncbi:MAG TPA: rRNA maturation RNase YbeY [Anaerolineae bacterium]|nr:rRNA maturation RNase YbeY [Anaerolineae bacterium]